MSTKKHGFNKKQAPNHISNRIILVFYDVLIFLFSFLFMFSIYRSDHIINAKSFSYHLLFAFFSVFFARFIIKVYSQVWRYGGIQSYIRLLISDGLGFLLLLCLDRVFFHLFSVTTSVAFSRLLSFSCINLLFSLSIRMTYRYIYKCYPMPGITGHFLPFIFRVFSFNHVKLHNDCSKKRIKVAIVGAGRMGISLLNELRENASSPYEPCCFVDNDKEKVKRQIAGLPVIDKHSSISLGDVYGVQEVIFAIPNASAEETRSLYNFFRNLGYQVKVYDYSAPHSAPNGRLQLREFDIEELLFRKSRVVIDDKTRAYYSGKTVLITGGGGSIGSELCRQVAGMRPALLIILDVFENGAYDVQQELFQLYGKELPLQVEILSVCNRSALDEVFRKYHPDVVLHAAAHKHVPLMEHNCDEAVENNVFGTLNTVELSEKYKVGRFMMVSTDKAVNPTNVMGATKRMCEMIVQHHSSVSTHTTFSATRFGNVLGSAGSVIPLFKRQIAKGGPITITDRRIVRYFMTIPEASQLVLQSASMAKNGELFVLDMGDPVKILDLAESMIRLSGFVPYRDIDIQEIGLRPGEKLYEELLCKTEELDKTENSLIYIERDAPLSAAELKEKLILLKEAVNSHDQDKVRHALHIAVPTFKTPEEVNASALQAKEMQTAITQS